MLASVFWLSLLTAVATGLGALPFLIWKTKPSKRTLAIGNAAAGGAMLGASIMLIKEGQYINLPGVLTGILAGIVFIIVVQFVLRRYQHLSPTALGTVDARKMLLIVAIMTLHSFSEGIGIGVSFSQGQSFGIFIALALAIHNIPEGLAISLVLVPRGVSAWKAAGWSVFSSLPQVVMAVPAFLFVETFHAFLAPGLGFAAGAMIWMCLHELLPEAREELASHHVALVSCACVALMIALEFAL